MPRNRQSPLLALGPFSFARGKARPDTSENARVRGLTNLGTNPVGLFFAMRCAHCRGIAARAKNALIRGRGARPGECFPPGLLEVEGLFILRLDRHLHLFCAIKNDFLHRGMRTVELRDCGVTKSPIDFVADDIRCGVITLGDGFDELTVCFHNSSLPFFLRSIEFDKFNGIIIKP